ncbi:MAG: SDR family NAD(P)-dependent oxidoreductase [Candidatus Hodarchaeota archaeon]
MNFKDKVALITGGASGIGKEAAIQFTKNGAKVCIFDINKETLDSTNDEIKNAGGECLAIHGDVRKKEDVDGCVEKAIDTLGGLDYLINCAGILKDGLIHKLPEDDFDDVIAVNLKGVYLFMQACAKYWVKDPYAQIKTAKKEGKPIPAPPTFPDRRIISISSLAAEGNIGQLAYGASKAGVVGMTKTAAKELIKYNIKAHAIMPTLIDTPIIGDLLVKDDGKWRKYYEGRIPLGIGKTKYVADAILFLCGPESGFMNGNVLSLNGGKIGEL